MNVIDFKIQIIFFVGNLMLDQLETNATTALLSC
jgi:hypothetical protein